MHRVVLQSHANLLDATATTNYCRTISTRNKKADRYSVGILPATDHDEIYTMIGIACAIARAALGHGFAARPRRGVGDSYERLDAPTAQKQLLI